MTRNYPWSAVVGQERLKHALLLCAIDPSIGGVLVEGQRGLAKTTLARALGELTGGPFVELPLGATEERVAGTLDLGKALREGSVQFSPGLLARAHGGVLYVDEVNLLPDGLVDLLLDAAASGRNTVERDGVSHAHPARFVLIGTMNPEEGELRPQLTDRFGLCVTADGQLTPPLRSEIVVRRLAFEQDPAAFCARYQAAQAQLVQRCQLARARAAQLVLSEQALQRAAEHCYAAGVEGVRADLAMLRAARAHAAWHERAQVLAEDVDAVAELALAHRRHKTAPPNNPPPSAGAGAGSSLGSAGTPGASASSAQSAGGFSASNNAGGGQGASASAAHSGAGSRGALQPVPVQAQPARIPSWLVPSVGNTPELRRKGARRWSAARGARVPRAATRGSIDWFATLAHSRKPRLDTVRYRLRRAPDKQLWVLAIDCSHSMLRSGGLARAKGLAHALERSAGRRGAHLALLAFGGQAAELKAQVKAARPTLQRAIDDLTAGGGTPLRDALQQAVALCQQRAFRLPKVHKRILLATDARSRDAVADLRPKLAHVELWIVDCERGPVRLGRAAQLASQLAGQCVHVDEP